MRNLTLITLLLLFCIIYSALFRIFQPGIYYTRSIEIVNEKKERESFELYLKLPSLVSRDPSCSYCLHPGNNEFKQQDLLELHNTKETTIGYFLML